MDSLISEKLCNGTVNKINNSLLISKVLNSFEEILLIKLNCNYFPGPQPVSIEKKTIELLKNKKYVVCEKTDGERYILLLIYIQDKPMCFLVNRNNTFYFIELDISQEMFMGSMFDGELILNNKEVWTFLIHDCMAYNGKEYVSQPHNKRYGAVIDFISHKYIHKDSDLFCIKTKLFYEYTPDLEKTWIHIQNTTEHKIDGLIFTPVYSPIIFGRQNDLLKWKNNGNHTIDFLTKMTPEKIYLYYSNKKVYKKIPKIDKNYSIIINFCDSELLSKGVVIEYNLIDDSLIPYRLRTDKDCGNSKITVENTLKNIKESLEIQDL